MAVLDKIGLLPLVYDQPHERGAHVVELATSWLRRYGREPFFLWLHLYDVHEPYDPPDGFLDPRDVALPGSRFLEAIVAGAAEPTELDVKRLRRLYAGEVRYVDHVLGDLWATMKELGLDERTCLILTADHGEELLDHARNIGHARFLYRSVCHVPLVFCNVPLRGRAVHSVPDIVRGVDLMPTILDLFGLETPEEVQGESLVPLMTGNDRSIGYAASETYREDGSLFKLSLVEGTRHLITGPGGGDVELYDLGGDPGELENLAEASPDAPVPFERRLKRWRETNPKQSARDVPLLNPADIKRLTALGYLR